MNRILCFFVLFVLSMNVAMAQDKIIVAPKIVKDKDDKNKDDGKRHKDDRKKISATSGTLKLSYGQYTGDIKKGYPHGQGRLIYTKDRIINSNDMKERRAQAGDYIEGEFYNGFAIWGKHYDRDGNLIQTFRFGVGAESSYDKK